MTQGLMSVYVRTVVITYRPPSRSTGLKAYVAVLDTRSTSF